MSIEMKIRLVMAALYGAGCLAIYMIVAFIAWNPEPGWFTRFAWVVWTLAVIGTRRFQVFHVLGLLFLRLPHQQIADDLKRESDRGTEEMNTGLPNGINLSPEEVRAYTGLIVAQRLAHETATNAGWYTDPATGQPIQRNIGEVIALMHSELSEALEAARKDLKDDKLPHRPGIEVEFADCVIRIFDTCAALGLDLAGAVIEKNRFNRTREDHKLANRQAVGGKKF